MSEHQIDPRFIVELKGRPYPTWPGILDAATNAGLRSLTTRLIQAPASDNGHVAIVQARAEFEDGRVFEDLGDASPANTSAMIATAAIRMASTRAKGRCLRDAVNCGMTMLEELPDDETRGSGNGARYSGGADQRPAAPHPDRPRSEALPGDRTFVRDAAGPGVGQSAEAPYPECGSCGKAMTKNQALISQRKAQLNACPSCLKSMLAGQ